MKLRDASILIGIALLSLAGIMATAQRKVTPVASSDELKPVTKEELKEIKRQEKLRFLRTDSLTLDSLRRDSIDRASKKVYRPTLMGATVGVNFWGPLMRLLGRDYGDCDAWVAVNFKNRYIPVAEVGFGQANTSPEDGNFTYKSKLAIYGKIGMNYNFMFAKDPKYQLYAGVRVGASRFNYDITNISLGNGYWGKDNKTFDITGQSASAIWGEAVAGIQVELFKNFSLGWAVRYNFPFHVKDTQNSRPYYIPGYGVRDSHLNVSVSVAYTIPFHKDKDKQTQPYRPTTNPMDTITVPERRLPNDSIE